MPSLSYPAGSTIRWRLAVVDDATGDPLDLTGADARLHVWRTAGEPQVVLTLAEGLEVEDAAGGLLLVSLEPGHTEGLAGRWNVEGRVRLAPDLQGERVYEVQRGTLDLGESSIGAMDVAASPSATTQDLMDSRIAAHDADTTNVHGIADTADLVLKSGNPINVQDYGAVPDYDIATSTLTTDSTSAFQNAINDSITTGRAVYVPGCVAGTAYAVGNLTGNASFRMFGDGKYRSRIVAKPGTTGYLLSMTGGSSQPAAVHKFQNHLFGSHLEGLFFDGRGRVDDVGGLRLELVDRLTVQGCQFRNFRREGVLCARSVRESSFHDTYLLANGSFNYPQLHITDSSANDGSNNLFFSNCRFVWNQGHNVRIFRDKSGGSSPIRNVFFSNCMFHGGIGSADGYAYTENYETRASNQIRLENTRLVFFSNCRIHLAGRGQALVYIGSGGQGSPVTGGFFTNCSFGTFANASEEVSQTTDPDTATVSAVNTALDTVTATNHRFSREATVRVISTDTLPSPLVAGTDYYVIRVDDDTLKLASTRVNAEAGTAIDLTSTGSGTMTLTGRSINIEIDQASLSSATVNGCSFDSTTDGQPGFKSSNTTGFAFGLGNRISGTGPFFQLPAGSAPFLASSGQFDAVSTVGDVTAGAALRGPSAVLDNGANAGLRIKDSVGTEQNVARIQSDNVVRFGNASLSSRMDGPRVSLVNGGNFVLDARDVSGVIKTKIGGTGQHLSFFGATEIAKPTVTGSRGGNAAVADLLTKLANLGLITDSTTA